MASKRRLLLALSALLLISSAGFFAVQAVAGEGDSQLTDEEVSDEQADREQAAGETEESGLEEPLVDERAMAPDIPPEKVEAGKEAFLAVAEVLQSPRCMNCHPVGKQPLQTDESRPHRLNISRDSEEAGLECATCHREQNSEAWGVDGGPPGAPHWGLPPAEMPMIFEGRTPRQLCEQLKKPEETGLDDLDGFLEHVTHDALVLWGWDPGGDRSTPPISHEAFVEQSRIWVESGGACPD